MVVFNQHFISVLNVLLDDYLFQRSTSFAIGNYVVRVGEWAKIGGPLRSIFARNKRDLPVVVKLSKVICARADEYPWRVYKGMRPCISSEEVIESLNVLGKFATSWETRACLLITCGDASFDFTRQRHFWPLQVLLNELCRSSRWPVPDQPVPRYAEITYPTTFKGTMDDLEKCFHPTSAHASDNDSDFYRQMVQALGSIEDDRKADLFRFLKNIVTEVFEEK